MLGTVKGVREADNKPRREPGDHSAAGLALEWQTPPARRQAGLQPCLQRGSSHVNKWSENNMRRS